MKDLAIVISNDNKKISAKDTIDYAVKYGFKKVFVQLYDKERSFSEIDQIKYCKENNLEIIFAHLGYSKLNNIWLDNEIGATFVDKYKKNLDTCKKYGIDMVVMHINIGIKAPKPNELGLKRFQEICDYAESLNIKVAFENTKLKGYQEYILDNIKNKNVGICIDVGHIHAHFKGKYNYERFKDRVFAVHIHDNMSKKDLHLIPTDGNIIWKKTLKKLKSTNYNGPLTLEVCYLNKKYLKYNPDRFFKKAKKVGDKLLKLYNRL